jgi:RNA polymerase sigma-70 factor (ECF subfamily)
MAWRVLQDVGLAEEVTQDVFLKLWQKSQRYDPGRGQFSSWLLSVTRFAAIDRLRREGRRPLLSEPPAGVPDDQTAFDQLLPTDHAAWERGQHLRLLLAQLPAEQREIIELAYFGGLTHSELAAQLAARAGLTEALRRHIAAPARLKVAGDGYGILLIRSPRLLREYDALGITVEPAGGSPGPTTPRVLGTEL